jgi:hypothetical protein
MLKLVILSLLFLAGCGPQFQLNDGDGFLNLASAEKSSCYYNIDPKGRLISWPHNSEIVFYIESRVPVEFRSVIEKAAQVWKPGLIKISDHIVESNKNQLDRRNIIYWIEDSSVLSNIQQATTITRWTQNKIIDSDILINASSFSFFKDLPALGSKIHLESLLMHEFGHALGMRHIPLVDSVMFFSLGYLQIRNLASEVDMTSLGCVYK